MARLRSLGSRDDALERIATERFDVLVAGGGIIGAGVALEATLRGHSCALVEKADFAGGASSRSTKLVHGGLRYLTTGGASLVREALAERAFLLAHAPTLVRPLPHVVPIAAVEGGADGVERLLAAYDGLAPEGLPRHRRLAADELATLAPALGRVDAFEYHEAQTDDARLTLAVLREAVAHGAVVANHLGLVEIEQGRDGVVARLDAEMEARASVLVFAVGAWTEEVTRAVHLSPSRGVHVVLPQPPGGLRATLVVQHPEDARPLSATPWKGRVLVGTTDTPTAAVDDSPASADEVAYLLAGVRRLLPEWEPPVLAAWTGVRPLLGGDRPTTALSREDHVEHLGPRVLAVAGGKLTTFRQVAARALARAPLPHREPAPFPTLSEDGGDPLAHEMVVTLDDLMTQRLGLSLVDPEEAAASAAEWSRRAAAALGWSETERERQLADYLGGLDRFRAPA